MTLPDPAIVGIDIGTSAVKVLAIAPSGRTVAARSEFYDLVTPAPLAVEQDANVLYTATMRVLTAVIADVRAAGSTVAAIGISSAMHGVLCIDARGEPLSNVITWMDRRSAAIAGAWRADGTGAALYAQTGAPMHAMLPLTKLRWLADNDADLVKHTSRFVGVKELFVHRLTGEWLIDWGIASATGMCALQTRQWSEHALDLARIDATKLSTLAAPSTAVTMRADVARALGLDAGIPVVLGSSDGALATIGSGAAHGDVVVTLGTSGAVRTLSEQPSLDPQGRAFCYAADDTRYVAGGPTSSAGAALDWIFALLLAGVPQPARFARAAELAAEIAAGANGCTVLPFLAGERAPYWSSNVRGSFYGLQLEDDGRTVLRAAFEGVVFGIAAVYDVLRERFGAAERLLVSGGITATPLVRAMIAATFGAPVVRPQQTQAAAFGAALLAARGIRLIDDVAAVARASGYHAPERAVEDDIAAYRAAYRRYRELVTEQLSR